MLWFPQVQYQSPGFQLLSRLCPHAPRSPTQKPRRLKFKFPHLLQIQSPSLAGPVAARFQGGGTDSMHSSDATDPMDSSDARFQGGGTDSMHSSDATDPMDFSSSRSGCCSCPSSRSSCSSSSVPRLPCVSSDPMDSSMCSSDATDPMDSADAADGADSWLHIDRCCGRHNRHHCQLTRELARTHEYYIVLGALGVLGVLGALDVLH